VLAFWNHHGAELKELFQPPQPILLPNLKGAALINELQPVLSPVLNESVSLMEAMFDGSLHIILTDWPAFLLFKAEYQAWSNTQFCTHNSLIRGGMTVKYFYCRC